MKTIDTVKIISDKHKAKVTGGLFLLDEQKKLIQIYFVDGDLVSIKTRNISGRDALNELTNMKPIKFQFHDAAETRTLDNLPSTPEIINLITEAHAEISQQKLLPDHVEDKARELFVEYVGPIADVIFEEQVEKSISPETLIQTLSSYIDDNKDKKAFIDAINKIT